MALSIYQLKPAFIGLLRPVATRLYHKGITANHITVLAAVLSILYGVLLAVAPGSAVLWFALPVWFFIRMALNAIDGILAREFDQKSRLGDLLNECGDIVADAALFVPLACIGGVSTSLVALFIWMALATEFAGTLGLLIGAARRYDGPMGKSDRAFVVSLCALLIGLSLVYGFDASLYLTITLWGATALMVLTAYNRMRSALRTPANQGQTPVSVSAAQ